MILLVAAPTICAFASIAPLNVETPDTTRELVLTFSVAAIPVRLDPSPKMS